MTHGEYSALMLRAMTAVLFLSGELRGSETRVLNAIIAESLMRQKERARITFTRIGHLAGLTRPVAAEAVKALMEMGFVLEDEGAWRLDVDRMQEASKVIQSQFFPNAA